MRRAYHKSTCIGTDNPRSQHNIRFFSPEMADTKKNLNHPNVTHAWQFVTIVRYEYGTIHWGKRYDKEVAF